MPSKPPFDELAAAIAADDTAAVGQLLSAHPQLGPALDQPLPDAAFGATALLAAVYHNNREMVDLLLAAGADIDARSHWWAGSFGVLDHDGPLTEYLISRGAIVDVHAAARLGRVDRLEALIAADPSLVHARGGDGQTPLHFASSIEVAQSLLDHGADLDARDIDHESTPAQWMVRERQPIARYLVERGCQTDILLAAALGDEPSVRRIVEHNPAAVDISVSEQYFPKRDPRNGGSIYNWTLGTGKTAHEVAHAFGHAGVLRLLMERSPEALRLVVACGIGDEHAVREILGRHPDLVRSLPSEQLRKLPDAARDENALGVRLMLDAGWPVDARGQHGATALHWAAWHGSTALTRTVLHHRPSLELTDHDHGGTAISWAVYGSVHGWRCATGDYTGTVELLLDAGSRAPELNPETKASNAVREVLRNRGDRTIGR